MEEKTIRRKNIVKVSQKINDGKRERVISFTGEVIKSRGISENKMITVRQSLDGVEVDRIIPVIHPSIVNIEVLQKSAKKKK